MTAPRVLVVFGTTFGHTAKLARRMGELLVEAGIDVTLTTRGALPSAGEMADYDGVIIGASVVTGRHPPWLREFVAANAPVLNRKPSAFISVCLNAASPRPAVRREAQRYIEAFLSQTAWAPVRAFALGGTLAYRRYNIVLRFIMKRIAGRNGLATDTSRDHEYTDWWKVEQFAREFAGTLRSEVPAWLEPEAGALTE